MPERIGFVGLGLMGKPMVRNLLKAGFTVTVFNRSRPAIDEMAAAGAIAASSPRAVAEGSDVIITMLPDAPDVELVALGPCGVIEGAQGGLLMIDMSTIGPVAAKRIGGDLRARGVHMLDAPVSGGTEGAAAGTLSIMVGGDPADLERARPAFDVLAKTITFCGPHGAGQIVKACNQAVLAIIIAAISEALVLGGKAGVQPAGVLRVLGAGLAQNRLMDLRGPSMIEHRFEPKAKVHLHRKDLGIVLQTAREHGVALPVTALVDQFFTTLMESGKGESDHSALVTVFEMLSVHSLSGRT